MAKDVVQQIAELTEYVNSNMRELAGDLLHMHETACRRDAGALETALTLIPSITDRLGVVSSMIELEALKVVAGRK